MLNKLAYRNAKRSMKDYLIYLITMAGIGALMFAFSFMIFSESIRAICTQIISMASMVGLTTFFIVLIVAWLINYMVRFMLEKRSKEFGTYLLIGMKKKDISRLYMRENLILGSISLVFGIGIGFFLQQVLMTIFYSLFQMEYPLHIEFSWQSLLMTVLCYYGCYFLALLRNRKVFKKMNISDLMRMEKENEKMKVGREGLKELLVVISICYFIFFFYKMYTATYTVLATCTMIVLFVVNIYLFCIGLSSFVLRYIKKGGKRIYRGQNLFLLRQMSSKLRTMRFTLGTLTVLLTCAILGVSVAMMFAQYQDKVLDQSMPFDILVYSKNPNDDFKQEITEIKKQVGVKDQFMYQIYRDETKNMNTYLYLNCHTLGNHFVNSDGTLDEKTVKKDHDVYYDYDTYIRLSDYNRLREMLGKKKITLRENEYALQIKNRIVPDLDDTVKERVITKGNYQMKLSHIYTDAFSQNGINGADYLIIIPDEAAATMKPYYKNLAAIPKRTPDSNLQESLYQIRIQKNHILPQSEFDDQVEQGKIDDDMEWNDITLGGSGSDQIVCFSADVIVANASGMEMRFIMLSIVFPMVYIGLVFLCVALTILAVQQLSDSNKYKFRYDVLRKLGLKEREVDKVVFKQLFGFYMIPAIAALILSGLITIFAGNQFVYYTEADGNGLYYYGIAVALFFGIYLLYFLATYIGFKRNISKQ